MILPLPLCDCVWWSLLQSGILSLSSADTLPHILYSQTPSPFILRTSFTATILVTVCSHSKVHTQHPAWRLCHMGSNDFLFPSYPYPPGLATPEANTVISSIPEHVHLPFHSSISVPTFLASYHLESRAGPPMPPAALGSP